MKPLTCTVTDYIAAEGFTVQSVHSLEISDNLAVGRRDPFAAIEAAGQLDLAGADALVLSACVQMPAAAAIGALPPCRCAVRSREAADAESAESAAGTLPSGVRNKMPVEFVGPCELSERCSDGVAARRRRRRRSPSASITRAPRPFPVVRVRLPLSRTCSPSSGERSAGAALHLLPARCSVQEQVGPDGHPGRPANDGGAPRQRGAGARVPGSPAVPTVPPASRHLPDRPVSHSWGSRPTNAAETYCGDE